MTYKQKGDIGVAKAIFYYTAAGYIVSIPDTDNSKYDLIVDKNGLIYRVQVKTITYKNKNGIYQVALRTTGGNCSGKGKTSILSDKNVDILFVLAESGEMYEIPILMLKSRSATSLGKDKEKYKLTIERW